MKDPAFLFYPSDYLSGTMGFSIEQHGAYLLALIYQFNNGKFTEIQIKNILNGSWELIKHKFTEENEFFFNKRLQLEQEKRKKYSESRSKNVSVRYKSKKRKKSTYVEDMKNICSTDVVHMEDRNRNRNRDIFIKPTIEEIKNYITEINSKIDPEYWMDYQIEHGWLVGKNKTPMKDWKACIRIWNRNNHSENQIKSQTQDPFVRRLSNVQ